jgi:hypothetical protein
MASAYTGDKGMWIWIGVAAGAAIGIGIALSRGKPTSWPSANGVTKRTGEGAGDLADRTKDIVNHVRTIYDESRKVVEEASDLWEHGRKLVRA